MSGDSIVIKEQPLLIVVVSFLFAVGLICTFLAPWFVFSGDNTCNTLCLIGASFHFICVIFIAFMKKITQHEYMFFWSLLVIVSSIGYFYFIHYHSI